MINVIGKKHLFLGISGLLVLAAIGSIYYFGLKPGIDFAGGVAWQFAFTDRLPTREDL
jgi:preprotein translocase subunit SecF